MYADTCDADGVGRLLRDLTLQRSHRRIRQDQHRPESTIALNRTKLALLTHSRLCQSETQIILAMHTYCLSPVLQESRTHGLNSSAMRVRWRPFLRRSPLFPAVGSKTRRAGVHIMIEHVTRNAERGDPALGETARRSQLLRRASVKLTRLCAALVIRWRYIPERAERADWESSYAAGAWDRLRGAEQLAHYSQIVGYCTHFKPGGSVLDVGCGEGLVQEKLRPYGYSRYVGLDLADAAIRRAAERGSAHALRARRCRGVRKR